MILATYNICLLFWFFVFLFFSSLELNQQQPLQIFCKKHTDKVFEKSSELTFDVKIKTMRFRFLSCCLLISDKFFNKIIIIIIVIIITINKYVQHCIYTDIHHLVMVTLQRVNHKILHQMGFITLP